MGDDSRYINPYSADESSASKLARPIRNSPPDNVKGIALLEFIFLGCRALMLVVLLREFFFENDTLNKLNNWTVPYILTNLAMLATGVPTMAGMLRMASWPVYFGWTYFFTTILSIRLELADAPEINSPFLVYLLLRIAFLGLYVSALLKFKSFLKAATPASHY